MTEIISLPRGGGKTMRMLEWMAAQPPTQNRVCVTITAHEANRLRNLAREQGLNIEGWRFVSAGEVKRGTLHGTSFMPTVLGVDNAELVLSALLGYEVGTLSVTPE